MIDVCPICGYSLSGLPPAHRCPECGLFYERDSEVIERPRLGWKVSAIVTAAMFAVGVVLWVWHGVGSFFLLGVIGFAASLWRLRRPKKMVLVSAQTVRIFGRGPNEETYRVADVHNAEWSRVTGEVALIGHQGTVVTSVPCSLLWSHKRSKMLASVINQYVARNREVVGTGGRDEGEKESGYSASAHGR